MNTLLFQSFQNQTVGMTAILTSGEGPGKMMMIITILILTIIMMIVNIVMIVMKINLHKR